MATGNGALYYYIMRKATRCATFAARNTNNARLFSDIRTTSKPKLFLSIPEDNALKASFERKTTQKCEWDSDAQRWREGFVPATLPMILQRLTNMPDFQTPREKLQLANFSSLLRVVVSNTFSGTSERIQALFETLDADRDTETNRKVLLRDRLDKEFSLLQDLSAVLEKANYYELPDDIFNDVIGPRTNGPLQVELKQAKYGVLRLWVQGLEETTSSSTGWRRLWIPRRSSYYRRVVTATRQRRATPMTLTVHSYRDVPRTSLGHLLPNCELRMSPILDSAYSASSLVAAAGAFAALISALAGDSTLLWGAGILCGTATLSAISMLGIYHASRSRYLSEANRTLHSSSSTSNQGLLSVLVEKAKAETHKETLLTYALLLAHRTLSTGDAHRQGALTESLLERSIEAWVWQQCGVWIRFQAHESLRLLRAVGAVQVKPRPLGSAHVGADQWQAVPLDSAIKFLPSSSLLQEIEPQTDEGTIDGYDRSKAGDALEEKPQTLSWGGYSWA